MDASRFGKISRLVAQRRLSRRLAMRQGVGAVVAGTLASMGMAHADSAQEATPAADCPTTTPEENEALARRHVTVRFTDIDAYDDLLTPDYIHHRSLGLGAWEGLEEFKANVQRTQDAFDAADITIAPILSAGDQVALAWTAQFTQKGEIFGAPATGRTGTWESMNIFRIECGRIAETWSVGDSLSLLMQLGIITPDELTTVGAPAELTTVGTPAP